VQQAIILKFTYIIQIFTNLTQEKMAVNQRTLIPQARIHVLCIKISNFATTKAKKFAGTVLQH
jgi:hypothetical protein